MPRDANGNYVLPAGNPVVSGSIIESTWANTTMPDLGAEMQDSLSRSGKGAMLAPMRLVDFDGPTPGLTFGNEPTTGLRRAAAGDARFNVLGTDVLKMEQALLTASVNAYFDGNVGIGTASPSNILHVSGVSEVPVLFERTSAANCTLSFKDSTTVSNPYLGCTGDNLYFATSGNERLRVDSSGNTGIGTTAPSTRAHVGVSAINKTSITPAESFTLGMRVQPVSASNVTGHIYSGISLGEYGGLYSLDDGSAGATAIAVFAGNNSSLVQAITVKSNGSVEMPFLPTTNPGGSGRLWNDGGTVKIT